MPEFPALVLEERDGKVAASLRTLGPADLPEGDVLVRVTHSTLNYKDGLILAGLGRLVRKYPHVPGIDFAGVVEELGVLDSMTTEIALGELPAWGARILEGEVRGRVVVDLARSSG